MNSFVSKLSCCKHDDDASSGDEIFDKDAVGLSHVGEAIHEELRKHHNRLHHSMWNVTSGKIIDSVHQTPNNVWDTKEDPAKDNDDWFPEKMADIIGRTEAWCDIMSLGPPDGKFMTHFQLGLKQVAERSKSSNEPIVVRMMFGNIVGMPVNCTAVIDALTKDLPKDDNVKLQLWVGAWRKGLSWNHAKMIAVDGVYLHTGGHNLWDAHYLSNNPVHDLSIEFEGRIARDGHRFANKQWQFVEKKQKTFVGRVVDSMPDHLPTVLRTRVTVSEYPTGEVPVFPPMFNKEKVASTTSQSRLAERAADVPLISIGRQGTLVRRHRPSDDAILAMIDSAKTIIRMVLQDIGPVCIPGTKNALPGLKWPKGYLSAIGRAIYERGVDIEMVLSNPNSIPGALKGTEANYGNGWDCVDVASEIVKHVQKQCKDCDDAKLRQMIAENLRICFVRHDKQSTYKDGKSIGLHSKHFIVDDTCAYIGSQNLYMCDLAEWGVVVDSEKEVKKIMDDYFTPLWKNSFTGEDVDVQRVMDGLNVNRDGEHKLFAGVKSEDAAQQLMPHGASPDLYSFEKEVGEVSVAEKIEAEKTTTESPVDDTTGDLEDEGIDAVQDVSLSKTKSEADAPASHVEEETKEDDAVPESFLSKAQSLESGAPDASAPKSTLSKLKSKLSLSKSGESALSSPAPTQSASVEEETKEDDAVPESFLSKAQSLESGASDASAPLSKLKSKLSMSKSGESALSSPAPTQSASVDEEKKEESLCKTQSQESRNSDASAPSSRLSKIRSKMSLNKTKSGESNASSASAKQDAASPVPSQPESHEEEKKEDDDMTHQASLIKTKSQEPETALSATQSGESAAVEKANEEPTTQPSASEADKNEKKVDTKENNQLAMDCNWCGFAESLNVGSD
eukprot:g6648.t1 g6648   contig23:953662-956452(+)